MRLQAGPSGGHEQDACPRLELLLLEKAQEPAEPFNPMWETVAQEQERRKLTLRKQEKLKPVKGRWERSRERGQGHIVASHVSYM